MWEDYDFPGGTFRENLLGQKLLRDDHYSSRFKYGKEEVKSVKVEKPDVAEQLQEVKDQKIPTYTSQPIAT
jgi:hypothetical protein